MTEQTFTTKQVKKALIGSYFDEVAKRGDGTYIARRAFYYRHGQTVDTFIQYVTKTFPSAVIVDSGEVWKAFKGGAPISRQSHWYVEFKFPEQTS